MAAVACSSVEAVLTLPVVVYPSVSVVPVVPAVSAVPAVPAVAVVASPSA